MNLGNGDMGMINQIISKHHIIKTDVESLRTTEHGK